MSSALRKMSGNASRHNCTVIFLNQLRHKARSSGMAFPGHCCCNLLKLQQLLQAARCCHMPCHDAVPDTGRQCQLIIHTYSLHWHCLLTHAAFPPPSLLPLGAGGRDLRQPRNHQRRPGAQVLRQRTPGGPDQGEDRGERRANRHPSQVRAQPPCHCWRLLACLRLGTGRHRRTVQSRLLWLRTA